MGTISVICALSFVIWYIVDRFKPIWDGRAYSKYITIGIAGILGLVAVLTFNLDILQATGLVPDVSAFGMACTVLLYMAGSSAIAEVIERIKGGGTNDD